MTLYKWSQTAASDATADSTINWAEGQAPSSVNDSARAMMAATAKYRDDIAGAIVTGGTSTAYTISSYEVFDTLAHLNGQMIAFTPHTTNGATVTLNVDSLGARPLRAAPNTELLAGTIIQGTPYVTVYNNVDGAFYLQGFFGNSLNIPLGGGMDFWGTTVPNSCFAFPVGQAISRSTYAALFAIMGTTYGSGDGSTTFNLPDKTGRVSAMKEATATRLTSGGFGGNSANMGAVGGADKNALSNTNQLPQFTPSGSVSTSTSGVDGVNPGAGPVNIGGSGSGGTLVLISSSSTFSGNPIGSVSPSSFATCQPTIICNYIIRVI
jgi:microcystin-dependent protein